ncbi:hypothetical protein SHIRM173S_04616 [Streptomyces hirsutus]
MARGSGGGGRRDWPRRWPRRCCWSGAAGAYLAASAVGGSGGGTTPGANGDGTPPPLTLDAYAEGGAHGIAPGEPNPYGATYRADGPLPEEPGSAPVYRARGQITEAQVAGLAKALGVDGKPVAEGEAWADRGQGRQRAHAAGGPQRPRHLDVQPVRARPRRL